MRLDLVKRVKVTWVFENQIYLYESVLGSIVANSKAESIRFELRDLFEEVDDFQVVSRKNRDSYVFKMDYYEDAESTFPLKAFAAQDEAIFYYEGSEGRAYFHLSQ